MEILDSGWSGPEALPTAWRRMVGGPARVCACVVCAAAFATGTSAVASPPPGHGHRVADPLAPAATVPAVASAPAVTPGLSAANAVVGTTPKWNGKHKGNAKKAAPIAPGSASTTATAPASTAPRTAPSGKSNGKGKGKGNGKSNGKGKGNGKGHAYGHTKGNGPTNGTSAAATATTASVKSGKNLVPHGTAKSQQIPGPGNGNPGGGRGPTTGGGQPATAAPTTPTAPTSGLTIPASLELPTGIAVIDQIGSGALLGLDAAGARQLELNAPSPGAVAGFAATASTLTTAPAVVTGSATTGGAPITGTAGSSHATAKHVNQPRRRAGTDRPSELQRIVDVIPIEVWIALAAAIAFALTMATIAWFERRRLHRQAAELAAVTEVAVTDPLTGILNRRGFTEAVERELARAKRYGHGFALAYVDVRGLKAVNDSQGHLAGDRLLQEVAAILERSARRDDYVGRIGGDEMGVLLAEQSAEGAEPVIRRIRGEVESRRSSIGISSPWGLTVGVAQYPDDADTVEGLMEIADRRLYEQRGIALR